MHKREDARTKTIPSLFPFPTNPHLFNVVHSKQAVKSQNKGNIFMRVCVGACVCLYASVWSALKCIKYKWCSYPMKKDIKNIKVLNWQIKCSNKQGESVFIYFSQKMNSDLSHNTKGNNKRERQEKRAKNKISKLNLST